MSIQKVCIVCGKEFSVPPCREKSATTCSNVCAIEIRAKSRERKVTRLCLNCGKEFSLPQSHIDRRIYCSRECKYGSVEWRDAIRGRTSGEKHPMWQGGETSHARGYVYKKCAGHPFAWNGYVFKHRLCMEAWLREESPDSKFLTPLGGQLYLSPAAIVHHIDGDVKNNSRRNLVVCSSADHRRIHSGVDVSPTDFWPPLAKSKLLRLLTNSKASATLDERKDLGRAWA